MIVILSHRHWLELEVRCKCRGLHSVLLQSNPELVVGGRQLHQGLLDPEGGVAHLAVLVPALGHQRRQTGQNLTKGMVKCEHEGEQFSSHLVIFPPLRNLRSVLVHTHNLVHVLETRVRGHLVI